VANELNRSPAVQVVAGDAEDLGELLQSAGKSPEDTFTAELAREFCVKRKGSFFTEGEIKPQGSGYVLDLSVRECGSGRTVARQEGEAKNKDDVMRGAGELAAAVRVQLSGRSSNSAGTAPVPLPTASLEAYKAYLVGAKLYATQLKQSAAVLRRATELDPNYAEAWNLRSYVDYNLEETNLEIDDLRHAFASREKLDDNEKASVDVRYHVDVTGEVYKAIDALHTWEKLQPNEFPPHNLLGLTYEHLGLYEKAADELRKNADLFPTSSLATDNYSDVLRYQGRYDEAAAVLGRLPAGHAVTSHEQELQYELATLRGDQATLENARKWLEDNADDQDAVSFLAMIDLYQGRLKSARQRTQHGLSISVGSGLSEAAAEMLLQLARGEGLYGHRSDARQTLRQALQLSGSTEIKQRAARAMVLTGQEQDAVKIISELIHERPADTFLNDVDGPIVYASSQLSAGQADAALRTLERTKPFEFGTKADLLPNYIRALAYQRLKRADDAAAEFKAILLHRGIGSLDPILVMSQLGLARIYAQQGDAEKSRASYESFFATWKDADQDIPVLQQAKSEYAKLH
jgi:eukaryotic-like serine/threonine-protein kinase